MKIHDVKITALKIIPDDRGRIMHMLKVMIKYLVILVKFTFQQFFITR